MLLLDSRESWLKKDIILFDFIVGQNNKENHLENGMYWL